MLLFDLLFSSPATLIFRGTDISKYFRESLGIRDKESRLYQTTTYSAHVIKQRKQSNKLALPKQGEWSQYKIGTTKEGRQNYLKRDNSPKSASVLLKNVHHNAD